MALSRGRLILLAGATFLVGAARASAHQPHDPVDALAISPSFSMDQTALVITDSYSFHRSTDGGFTWTRVMLGLNNRTAYTALAFSPDFLADRTVLVGTSGDGVYRSQDRGVAWEAVNDGLDTKGVSRLFIPPGFAAASMALAAGIDGGLFRASGEGLSWNRVMDTSVKITSLASSPGFVLDGMMAAGDDSGRLYLSLDRGETWAERTPAVASTPLTAIAFSPGFAFDATMFLGFYGGGVHRSTDGGVTFARIKTGTGLSARRITTLAVSPAFGSDSTVFACGADAGVYRSVNGGSSWRKVDEGIYYRPQGKTAHYRSLAISDAFASDGVVLMGAFEGLFRTADRGETWLELEAAVPSDQVSGIAFSPQYAADATLWVSTYGGGAYRQSGAGTAWSVQNVGLERPYLYDIAVSPDFAVDSTVLSVQWGFLARSSDGGALWTLTSLDTSRSFPSSISLSPSFSTDRTIFLGSRYEGVYRSRDGGVSFERLLPGMGYVTTVAVSPVFESDRTAFAGTFSRGIYKTVDGGDSWERVNVGLDSALPILDLVVSSDFGNDEVLLAGTVGGLFRSGDGGGSWQLVELGDGVTGSPVFAVALSPDFSIDGHALASVSGAGLYRTLDHGITWSSVSPELATRGHLLHRIRYSPAFSSDGTLYGAAGATLLRSSDRGASWTAVPRPARYEAIHDKIRNQGAWKAGRHEQLSAHDFIYSNHAGDRSVFDFVGTGVSWVGPRTPLQGIANVYVDGALVSTVDGYSPAEQAITTLFSAQGLPAGPHAISIEVTGGKQPNAADAYVVIDAFDVVR